MMSYIYIACSLTHVKKEHFEEYTKFIKELAVEIEKDFKVHCKYALRDSDPKLGDYPGTERPRLCYEWDKNMVEESSLVIAEGSFPSTGLGIEIEIANQNSIPVLLVYRSYPNSSADEKEYTLIDGDKHLLEIGNRIVSVMVEGCPAVIEKFEYNNNDDGIFRIKKYLKGIDALSL